MSNICDLLKANLCEALDKTVTQAIQEKLDSGEPFNLGLDEDTTVTIKDGKIYGINTFKSEAYARSFLADVSSDLNTLYGINVK